MTQSSPDSVHYLTAIRERLESLYELLPDDPRLREHISDEVDWINSELERLAGLRPDTLNEGCIICANGNDLPEGEHCCACGREGAAFGLRAAVIKARGRMEPPSTPVAFAAPSRVSAGTEEDWQDDPASDERWNAGLDFAMEHLCKFLGVNPREVNWDAATETLDGDVMAVIGNVLRAKFGEDWGPDDVAQPSWQPIETAPKDGTHILAYRLPIGIRVTNLTNPPTVVHWFDDPDEPGFYTSVNELAPEHPFNPTHWKPLDAPPSPLSSKRRSARENGNDTIIS